MATLQELIAANPEWATWTDKEVSDEINRINPSIQIDRDLISAYEIIEATVPSDWATLSAAEKQRYQTLTGAGDVNLKGANTRAMLGAMFAAGTQTRTNLVSLQTRPGTLGEQNNLGTVSHIQVAEARGRVL